MTLDPDVARLIDDAVHQQRRPMKQVINDALRRALAPQQQQDLRPFQIEPHTSRLRPGLDLAGFNRLADELDDEAIVTGLRNAS
ncbi:type II toxin-antitoxin system antitoxin VapB33 [Microlunatus parietis]